MTQLLGHVIADFETQLAAKISVGDTTGNLTSATDDDGVALPAGRYFFTIDKGNSKKEHISCSLSGTTLTNIKSVSRQGVETSGVAREHRVGANVIISDFAHIKKINDLLDGTTDLDSDTPLKYDGTATISDDAELTTKKYVDDSTVGISGDETVAGVKTFSSSPMVPTPTTDYQASTKKYVDDIAIAGAPDASTTGKGVVEIATDAQVTAGTDTGETGAKLVILPSQLASVSSATFVAGENLTAGEAVILASGTESALLSAQSSTNTTIDTTNSWWYQSYTTDASANGIKAVILRLSGSGTWSVTIRANPTGSNLITPVTYGPNNVGTDSGDITFIFPTVVTVTPSTTYYIVVNGPGLRGGTTSSYSGGVSGTSSTAGVSWTTPATTVTGDFYFKAYEVYTVAGKVYKTSADSATYVGSGWTNNFIGFVTSTVSSGANAIIKTVNIFTGLTGLTTGLTYYLSNTAGAISTSAGTVSKKIGLSTSTTSLLIKHDN